MSETWTLGRMLAWASPFLQEHGSESPRLDAELLLCAVTGLRRLDLYVDHERPLQPDELERFRGLIRRRAHAEPVAYILGRKAFHNVELDVGPGVLVPRPETESLVDRALQFLASETSPSGMVVDVGTGSGAIALALADALRSRGDTRPIGATDISPEALNIARSNAVRMGLDASVSFAEAPLLGPFAAPSSLAGVYSNPPYIRRDRLASLPLTVRGYEPRLALDGGEDGLDVLRPLAQAALVALRPGGQFAAELGDREQGRTMVQWLQDAGAVDARCDPIGPGPTAIISARRAV